MADQFSCFVAVHGGAGDHPPEDEQAIKKLLRRACSYALQAADSPSPALDAVQSAICIMENDPLLNAGYGSNLTEDGRVECDASIARWYECSLQLPQTPRILRRPQFGSVGAVGGVNNPILAARAVLDASLRPSLLHRVSPLTLVSGGARSFAERNGVPVADHASLVAPGARELWETWSQRLRDAETTSTQAGTINQSVSSPMQDTVGAVALCGLESAAGVSSGGILLKLPGRVGEVSAVLLGFGNVACSVSGTGEDIVRTGLARAVCEEISRQGLDCVDESITTIFTEHLKDTMLSDSDTQPSAGLIVLTRDCKDDTAAAGKVRLWCAFTTLSMAVGYATAVMAKPKATILRRPSNIPGFLYITEISLDH
ncbi:N-terminal nucleophile aminohydrolase [Auriculariales sp. MPI-PUGE-AT-0066]|nr:N-terminal nucleophile aminohydrolase [Auriculariales sp. MPI-PUGE-AT-0066]